MERNKIEIDVADAELAVLDALWDRGPSTIRQLADVLYPTGRVSHYATVQKLLERLESKGLVGRDREGYAHVFRPLATREEFAARQLQATADKICGGSLIPLLTNLVRSQPLNDRDRDELKALLDELESRSARATPASNNRR